MLITVIDTCVCGDKLEKVRVRASHRGPARCLKCRKSIQKETNRRYREKHGLIKVVDLKTRANRKFNAELIAFLQKNRDVNTWSNFSKWEHEKTRI